LSGGNLYIPNANINVVINYSQNDQRAQVDVHVSHKGDIDVVLHEIQALNAIMATARVLRGKVTRPPVLKGVTKNGKHSYTVTVTAIAEPMTQVFVERYMRYQLMRLMQRIGVDASATTLATENPSGYAKPPVVLSAAGVGTNSASASGAAVTASVATATLAPARGDTTYSRVNVATASLYRPDTERGDVSIVTPRPVTVAETLRHDADVVYDGHLNRRRVPVPPHEYGRDMGIDDTDIGQQAY
jgi:hypothetical protein